MPTTGSRVRLTVRGRPTPVVGSFVSATGDSIVFVRVPRGSGSRKASTADTTTLALSAVNTFEVGAGVHHHLWRSIGWGVGGGALGGAVIGAATYSPCHETGFMACFMEPENRGQAAMFGAVIGGVLGTATGLVVGAFHRSEDWRRVSTDQVARLRVAPTPRGLGAQLSLTVR